jgi:lipopolysaccharide transport system ATP-binding protein
MKPIIRVRGIGKRYVIGRNRAHRTLRESLSEAATVPLRIARGAMRQNQARNESGRDQVWALRDVSFDVNPGEVLGIIGRNGAGKSTLLKILSRITDPTEGRAELDGRVGSLLEAGTGFHPELTGRENLYLSGTILGMRRAEIARKFDEIVAFAEVDKFLDTPVKHYSSGMYVRLAFAVAAHLEPEILVVDEVLAVGDAAFQKKCLGKMSEVAEGGRTVLFVSHNMPSINRLCKRCVLLDGGRIMVDADTQTATAQYMISDTGTMATREWAVGQRPGDEVARLIAVGVSQQGEISESIDIRYPVDIEMTYEVFKQNANLLSAFSFFDSQGVHLFVSGDLNDQQWSRPRSRGIYSSVCRVPGNLFSEGIVRVVAEVSTRQPVYQIHFLVYDSVAFQVVDCGEPGSVRGSWGRPIPGVMRPLCEWQTAIQQVAVLPYSTNISVNAS